MQEPTLEAPVRRTGVIDHWTGPHRLEYTADPGYEPGPMRFYMAMSLVRMIPHLSDGSDEPYSVFDRCNLAAAIELLLLEWEAITKADLAANQQKEAA